MAQDRAAQRSKRLRRVSLGAGAPMQASAPAEAVDVPKAGHGRQARQAKIRALESFLKRVASRRQQIESESVA